MVRLTVKIGDKIGAGSFGKIYRATEETTNTVLVFKVSKKGVRGMEDSLTREFEVYRAVNAVQSLSAFVQGVDGSPPPRFPFVFGVFTSRLRGTQRLLMECLGDNLDVILHKKSPDHILDARLFSRVAVDVLDALQVLHRAGYVHRDLKPQNMALGLYDNGVRLLDLGLARKYVGRGAPSRHPTGFAGTVRFASLAAHMHLRQDPWDDLESLGYVLLYLATGRLPWQEAADLQELKEDKQRRVFFHKLTTTMETLCTQCRTPGASKKMYEYLLILSRRRESTPDYDLLKMCF